MSTKRYLESLPQAEQDDILGLPPDEWTEEAENEPNEDDAWWARMLAEEGDEQCLPMRTTSDTKLPSTAEK